MDVNRLKKTALKFTRRVKTISGMEKGSKILKKKYVISEIHPIKVSNVPKISGRYLISEIRSMN